jgi:hypothetical protein
VRSARGACAPLALALLSQASEAAEPAFAVQHVEVPLRPIQADLVDLDGDRRGDLLWTGSEGMPPTERRVLHAHFGAGGGSLPSAPDWSAPLPAGASAYDLADLDGRAGAELVLLRRDRLTLVSLHARTPEIRDLAVPVAPTFAIVQDERGLDRLALARAGLGAPLRLLVPGLGQASLLEPDGTPVASLEVGARANFFLPPRPGPLIAESELEIYLDHPRLAVADVDGDGRGDLLASDRHELRVFLQREGGGFAGAPDRAIALRRLSEADHIRSSGSVRIEPHDLDADGRADLLISTTTGSIFGGTTELTLHRNTEGAWNLDRPDQRFEPQRGVSSHSLRDLDGDGRAELVSIHIPTGVLEIVEILVTRAIDVEVSIHRSGDTTLFREEPWLTWTQGVGMSFETFRPIGFIPTAEADVNGDGRPDLVGSGDGSRLEIQLGDPARGFARRKLTQPLDTGGRIRFGDLDADGGADFVVYDARRPGAPLRVGRSLLVRTPELRAPEAREDPPDAAPAAEARPEPTPTPPPQE